MNAPNQVESLGGFSALLPPSTPMVMMQSQYEIALASARAEGIYEERRRCAGIVQRKRMTTFLLGSGEEVLEQIEGEILSGKP